VNKLAYWSLCLLIFLLPWEMFGFLGAYLPSVARIVGMITVLFGATAIAVNPKIRPWPRVLKAAAAFGVWSAATIIWSFDRSASSNAALTTLLLALFLWLIWQFAPTVDRQLGLIRAFIAGQVVPLLLMYVTYRQLQAADSDLTRVAGAGNDGNYLAEMYVIGIVFATYLAFGRPVSTMGRLMYLGFILLAGFGTFLTGSRAGFTALVLVGLGVLAVVIMSRALRAGTKVGLLLLVLAIVIVGYLFVPGGIMNRLFEVVKNPDTLRERTDAWSRGVNAFLSHPLQGVGGNAFIAATATREGERRIVSHNVVITTATEKGLVGIGIYCTMLYAVFKSAWRMPKIERMLWIAVLSTWFLCALSAGNDHDKLSWFLFGLATAQGASYRASGADAFLRTPRASLANRAMPRQRRRK
jgi:O-antigen ligase